MATRAAIRLRSEISYSDRSRHYYWPRPKLEGALNQLIKNSGCSIRRPLTLLSQCLPRQYEGVCAGRLKNDPEAADAG